MTGLSAGEFNFDSMFSRSSTIPACEKQTNGIAISVSRVYSWIDCMTLYILYSYWGRTIYILPGGVVVHDVDCSLKIVHYTFHQYKCT